MVPGDDEDAHYKIEASFSKLFSLPLENGRPSFSPHLHRQYADNRIIYPRPGFCRTKKKLSCVSMLKLPRQSCMIMVGRAMKPSPPLKHLRFNFNLFTTTMSAEHRTVNLKASWKWMSRELKAVCFYLNVLVQRDSAQHLTRGYTTIIPQCQIWSHCSSACFWANQHWIDNST